MTRIGKLRDRVYLLRPSSTKGEYGADVVSWTTEKEIWAGIQSLSGLEYFTAQQIKSGITHRVTIRYTTLNRSTAIGPLCRFETKRDNRTFEVQAVLDMDNRRRFLDCLCKETS